MFRLLCFILAIGLFSKVTSAPPYEFETEKLIEVQSPDTSSKGDEMATRGVDDQPAKKRERVGKKLDENQTDQGLFSKWNLFNSERIRDGAIAALTTAMASNKQKSNNSPASTWDLLRVLSSNKDSSSNGGGISSLLQSPLLQMITTQLASKKGILEYNHATATQEYLKRLAPHSLRGKLWAKVLGSETLPWHKECFKNLKQLVGQYEMMVDKLIFKDIQLTVCNDDQYFVFEDLLYQVMLCFSRDTFVSNIFRCNGSNPIMGILKGKSNTIGNAVMYPPNGVIPFHGFSMYAAPLCYIYNDAIQLYFSVRSFYMRFWFRLHEVHSHPQSMLSLCCLFQHLLEFHEPNLCAHFASINIQPIKVVFKWLMRCFSGHLPPEQLLYLWDIILGYNSLEVIPLLAVAILSFRKENLLQVDTLPNVEAILADLSSIHVIPLLQFILLSE